MNIQTPELAVKSGYQNAFLIRKAQSYHECHKIKLCPGVNNVNA